jgi:predicted O-methyltransferase YrrM
MGAILAAKPVRLLGKVVRHPDRAALRLITQWRVSRERADDRRARLLAFLSERYGVDAWALDAEYAESGFGRWYQERVHELRNFPGPYRVGTSGDLDCRYLYLLVRAARPRTVIETGVLYGASSGHILAALQANKQGTLHSIELGRESREPPHDFFVPAHVQYRWNLIIGDSRQALPKLVDYLPSIDLFHHDSLHTFDHMTWEFETVFPHLAQGGVLSSHDVAIAHGLRGIFKQNAFPAFCTRHRVDWATFGNTGLLFRSGSGTSGATHSPAETSNNTASLPM